MADHRLSSAPLDPTFKGYIGSTVDALILFEACLCGRLSHVPRRPHDRERASLIKSGHVFIYEEHSSGIKRWTDGVSWSPSRILGNFLLYRELDKPFQPGEKKRAMKRKLDGGVSKTANTPRSSSASYSSAITTSGPSQTTFDSNNSNNSNSGNNGSNGSNGSNGNNGRESERAYVGSLVDSYQFKQDGLIKKTISIQYRGVQHHLVSYYSLDDVLNRRLTTPTSDFSLQHIQPRAALVTSATFRAPVDDQEFMVGDHRLGHVYAMPQLSEYGVMSSIAAARSLSVPSIPQFANTWGTPASYVTSTNYALAASLPPVNYPQPTSTYTYDQDVTTPYRMPPSSHSPQAFNSAAMMQARAPSALHASAESSHIGYSPLGISDRPRMSSTPSLSNSYGLSNQRLPQSAVNGGSVFEPSGSAHTPSHGSNAYGSDGPSQHSGTYGDGSGATHQSNGFNGAVDTSPFGSTPARHHAMPDFGGSLSEATAAFVSASHDSNPSGIPLSLEQSESVSTPIADSDMATQWSTTLGNSNHY